jgi:salicylate hydroxylase
VKNYSSHIGIIGGGIAGLTVGCALRLQGINTIVFERAEEISEYGAGISISPNALGPLQKLGIRDGFVDRSFVPEKAVMHYRGKEIRSLETQVVTSSRQKLIETIYQRYIELGGEIFFEHEYKSLDANSCDITFTNNEAYKVSHVLACDGIKSSARQNHFPSSGVPTYSGYSAWRGIGLSGVKDIQFHFGPGTHIVNYPIDHEGRTSFVGVVKTNETAEDSWKTKGSKEAFLEDFRFYDEKILSMVSSSEDIYKWGVYIRPPLNSMYTKNITLLGDAAHPMVPFLGQGGCMAIEDAYTFAGLAKELDCDFKKVQVLYEKIRLQRNNRIQSTSALQGKLNHIKNPLAAFIRNLILRHTPLLAARTEKIWNYNVDEEISKALK